MTSAGPLNSKFLKTLRLVLDGAASQRSTVYLANDPLSFCRRFTPPADQEIAALIASAFAYGSVKIILKNLEVVFSGIGCSPSGFVDRYEPDLGKSVFTNFKHRFNDARDLSALLWAIRLMRAKCGSLERFFGQFYNPEDVDVSSALRGFCHEIRSFDYTPVFGQPSPPADSSFPFLFPSPQSGSACKRLNMFLRWVVRPDDGIDLGLWKSVAPSQLIIPVDTHVSRIAGYLQLTNRRQADWKMAQEITAALRLLDPDDPVKYDFAIAHLGISDKCDGFVDGCKKTCPIASVCCRATHNHP